MLWLLPFLLPPQLMLPPVKWFAIGSIYRFLLGFGALFALLLVFLK